MSQPTSKEAYHSIQNLGERQRKVYDGIKKLGSCTNLELAHELILPINQVTPRTNELVKKNIVKQIGTRPCKISKRNAIVWGLVSEQ